MLEMAHLKLESLGTTMDSADSLLVVFIQLSGKGCTA